MVNKNDMEEMIEVLGITTELVISSDDAIYDSYMEWPELKSLDEDTLEYLKGFIDDGIEYNDEDREDVFRAMRESGIPDGDTQYELAGNMPEGYGYFNSQMDVDDDYLSYIPLPIEEYQDQMNSLMTNIKTSDNDLVRKSLILTMLILTESFAISKARRNALEKLNQIKDKKLKKYIKKIIEDDAIKSNGRVDLIKSFVDSDIGNVPERKLRNYLAHDIGNKEIILSNGDITYPDKKRGKIKISLTKLFKNLLEYVNEIEIKG